MTSDDIICMAQKSGWEMGDDLSDGFGVRLSRFAALVAAAERERLRAMLVHHRDQTTISHHVTLAECHAARNALQLVIDEWL